MARKEPANAAAAQSRVFAAATQNITPPSNVPLESGDMPFFASVIAEFARSEWTAHQLELAAILARTMADLVHEQAELRREGSVTMTERGTPVINPRKTAVQMHAGTILSMRRSLALHARARTGDNRHAAKQNDIAKDVEAGAAFDADDLLARPI